ncbi:hypothetical protein G6F65_022595 [Rhizopus arrhizus]|nr:hypothetical protein G6F65_022595 [Rhizopus arrhizus]
MQRDDRGRQLVGFAARNAHGDPPQVQGLQLVVQLLSQGVEGGAQADDGELIDRRDGRVRRQGAERHRAFGAGVMGPVQEGEEFLDAHGRLLDRGVRWKVHRHAPPDRQGTRATRPAYRGGKL